MMMIKPRRIQPNTGAIIPVNVLDTSKSSLDDLFHRFVDFIDAKTTVAKRCSFSLLCNIAMSSSNGVPFVSFLILKAKAKVSK